jgi:hypothetical protein
MVSKATTKRALRFAGKEVAKGALQATGSILIYVLVLWAVYSNFFSSKGRDTLDSALKLKAPGMTRVLDRGNQGAQASEPSAYM